MMENIDLLVSVIIPVYNGRKFIQKGIESVLRQTYEKIELILIEDGSVESSEDIVMSYRNNCIAKEVLYYKQENQGIAAARNAGIMKASGEYIMFLDQDDWLEKDCIEKLLMTSIQKNADIVIGGVNKVSESNSVLETITLREDSDWSALKITAPWGRIFRAAFIRENDICFFSTKISEDLYFNMLSFSKTSKIQTVSYVGYNWVQRKDSESHANWSKLSLDRNPIVMLQVLHDNMGNELPFSHDRIVYFFTKYIVWYFLYVGRSCTLEEYIVCKKTVFEWLTKQYPDYKKTALAFWKHPKEDNVFVRLCVFMIIGLKSIGMLDGFMKIYRRI